MVSLHTHLPGFFFFIANILVQLQSLLTSLDTLLRCICVWPGNNTLSVLSVSSTLQYWRISSSNTPSARWRLTLNRSYKKNYEWSVCMKR